jgi:hypothetical protein
MIDLSKLSESVLFGVLIVVAVIVIGAPLSLRLAGLTGAQILEAIQLTLQFFVNLVRAYRDQNKQS